jgi:hypothetical protein
MQSITNLSGTDTFETWFNRTNTIISELNKANPRLISVRDFGATGNGIIDDTAGISAALTALNGLCGGVLYFPKGNYLLTGTGPQNNRQIQQVMTRPFHIMGDQARIVCGTTAEYMWFIANAGHDFNISGIQFDGNNKALACLRIEDSDGSTGTIQVDRCGFFNTFSGGDLGTTLGGGGLFISGSKYINLTNSQIVNHSRANGVGVAGSAGTVGVAIARSGNGYPKHVNVSGCYFENVTSGWTQGSGNADCDCLSVFGYLDANQGLTGITFNDSTATITNNHFRNCKGRSIKIQNDRSIIANNTFYKNILSIDTPTEVNAQFVVGQIYNNNFYYEPTSTGLNPFRQNGAPDVFVNGNVEGHSCISFFNGTNIKRTRSYTVSGNQVINAVPKSLGVPLSFVTVTRGQTNASGPLFFTATDNKIIGPLQFFGNVTTHDHRSNLAADAAPTFYTFTNNMVERLTDNFTPGRTFGWLWSNDFFSATMNNFSLINNVNGTTGATADILYTSSVFKGAGPLSGFNMLTSGATAHKINNYKIN